MSTFKLPVFALLITFSLNAVAAEEVVKKNEKTLVQNVWNKDLDELKIKLPLMKKNDFVHSRCPMGLTILHHASVIANIPMLEFIVQNWLAHKLDLDELAGRKGSSPAHSALQLLSKNTPEVLRVLKESGATCDIQRGIDMKTPLDIVESEIALRLVQLKSKRYQDDKLLNIESELSILYECKKILESAPK